MKTSQDFNENFNQYSSEIEKEMSNLNRMLQEFASNGVVATAQVTLDELQASIEKFWEQGWERNEEAKRTCQANM